MPEFIKCIPVLVFLWPGFLEAEVSAELLSVSVMNRAPYALCAKPAWWKQPHLQNRVYTPGGHRALPTIEKLLGPANPICTYWLIEAFIRAPSGTIPNST
jgi:hypothetical protein